MPSIYLDVLKAFAPTINGSKLRSFILKYLSAEPQ
jgi:hypothetical protein